MTPIKRILIAGAGKMGLETAYQCAAFEYDVILYDIDRKMLDEAKGEIVKLVSDLFARNDLRTLTIKKSLISSGLSQRAALKLAREQRKTISPRTLKRALKRITLSSDPAAAKDVDLIIESIPEDPALKGRVFAEFDQHCPPHTIFATNTSTLLPSMFAEATGRPDRVAALHFHPPIWDSQIVDVMPHAGTDPAVIEALVAFTWSIDQIPVTLTEEISSYIFNNMLNALLGSAMKLAVNGIASIEAVDRSWMSIMKTPAGPFGIMDGIGLQTIYHITKYWADQTRDPQALKNLTYLQKYVDNNWLGVKTGRGFYEYPDPVYTQPGFITEQRDGNS